MTTETRTERLARAKVYRDELDAKFRSYDGGDRPMSPPASLLRELSEAEDRAREIEAESDAVAGEWTKERHGSVKIGRAKGRNMRPEEQDAALAEIDRLRDVADNYRALLAAAEKAGRDVCAERDACGMDLQTCRATLAEERSDGDEQRTEIERLRAELAARPAPAADASLEARAFGPHDAAAMASDLIGESRGLAEDDPRRGARLAASLMGLWLRAVDASRPWHPTPERAATVIAFLRGNFFNDGAEGESVHLVCDMLETALARRPGLTEEQARAMAGPLCREMFNRIGLAIGNGIGAPEWMVDMMTAALLRASRGEASPVPTVEIEGLGPEPGILAPAVSDAAPPPVPADQVAIPRAVLERLVEATCYAPNVRVEREIARRALQLDLMRHEPARTDPAAARAAAKRGGQ